MDIKVITYNIDGLPATLDLRDLPWIFKPIAWIYKLIKGTTVITVNDSQDIADKTKSISTYLAASGSTIVGVQEDFNYHSELMNALSEYKDSTFTGDFTLPDILSSITWLPPRLKADGLNFIYKKDSIKVKKEDIVSWNDSYGYFDHANDKLTHKGFRAYTITMENVDIDVYVLHMDADFYNPYSCPDVSGDIEARRSQLEQLSEYIITHSTGNPTIIMGDTNSTEMYSWDRDNIKNYLINPINATSDLYIKEAVPSNAVNVDRIFYINSQSSPYIIKAKECFYDEVYYSDHTPLVATLSIEYKSV